MRKNQIVFSRQLLLTAILFVSGAAIITGTILSTYTTTAALAAKTTTKENTGTTSNTNETLPTGSSLPLPTPSTSTTTTTKKSNGDVVTTQGTLSSESALASTDIVNSVSTTYEVLFTTATTATIAKVLVTFPSGFGVSSAKGLEVSGMGSSNSISSVSISGQTITFNIQSPVSVSAGVKIRIEVGNIKNPGTASSNYQVTVTTKRSDGTTIDGPTISSIFSIRKVGSSTISDNSISTSMIKDHAVTGSKIAGISKLVFIKCDIADRTYINPGDYLPADCNNPSIAAGDAVVATRNSGIACFDSRMAAVPEDGRIRFYIYNECSAALPGDGEISVILFKRS